MAAINPDARLSAADVARYLNVSKQLVNYWRVSGKLQRGQDRRYRLGDAIDVERDSRRSPWSSRRTSVPA